MRRWHASAVVVLVAACGRFGFQDLDASVPSDGDGGDDAADSATVSRCAGTAYLECDEFEAPTFDAAQWLPFGATALDTAFSHSGGQSVHVHLAPVPAATAGGSGIDINRSFVTGPATVWIRAWFRVASLPVSTNAMELIAFVQTGAPNFGNDVFLRSTDTQLYHQWNTDSGSAGSAPPLNTWFCLVWNVVRSTTTTGGSFLTSDIVPPVSLPNTVTDGTPPMDLVSIGAFFSATNVDVNQPTIDLWFDDVIVSDTAVGCAD